MLKRGTILLLALILLCSIVSAEDWPGGQVSATASDYFRDVRSDGTNIYVAFIDTSGFDVEFSYSNDFGSTWHDSTVDANVPGMNAVFTHYTGGELFVIYQLGTGVWTAKSIDGGNEWGKSQSLPSATGYFSFDGYGGYFFVPYYSGTNLVMGKSENAGDNYLTSTITTSAKSPNPGIPGVYALDSDNVFVAYHNGSSGYIALAKTIDSGDNWELMPVVSETAGYLYVYASDVNHIFVLYRTGTTYKIAITSDGGSTWSAHTVGTGGTGYFDLAGIGNNIFVSYAPSDNKLHEHYSYDNGATWT
ncbi:hypothetical protein KY328_01950, partial [Candidatus Woesearchaeota archaeon]|nr:hypothetical protein [Candidatus Woesearchaeota archaeon]